MVKGMSPSYILFDWGLFVWENIDINQRGKI